MTTRSELTDIAQSVIANLTATDTADTTDEVDETEEVDGTEADDETEGDESEDATSDDDGEEDDGEEESTDDEVDLDQTFIGPDGEETTLRELFDSKERRAVSTQRFQQAAELKKEAEQLRAEAEEATAFVENLAAAWGEDPTVVLSDFFEQAVSPEGKTDRKAVRELLVQMQIVALRLDPDLADDLGIDEDQLQQLLVGDERKRLERERKALQSEKERSKPKPEPVATDPFGVPVPELQESLVEILKDEGIAPEDKDGIESFLNELLAFRNEHQIRDINSAHRRFNKERAARAEAAKKITKKVVKKASQTPAAALAPKGKATHEETAPIGLSVREAALRAVKS